VDNSKHLLIFFKKSLLVFVILQLYIELYVFAVPSAAKNPRLPLTPEECWEFEAVKFQPRDLESFRRTFSSLSSDPGLQSRPRRHETMIFSDADSPTFRVNNSEERLPDLWRITALGICQPL